MSRFPILDICARLDGHAHQQKLLIEYCRNFTEWHALLSKAETEGMAPLLRKHLREADAPYPVGVQRSLNVLYEHHKYKAQIRLALLQEVIKIFRRSGLRPILIKGAALCYTLYHDPALRPMRDIDLLFDKSEVDQAQALLREFGFSQSALPIPKDHHHLPSLHKIIDGVEICIELHRGLYPNCQPYYPKVDFDNLYSTGITISMGSAEATTFNLEETIHYIYQHGLRAPLTYEPYKLINVADIISFIEKYGRELNWEEIKMNYPILCKAIPLLHYVSPWNPDRLPERIEVPKSRIHLEPKAYRGWPNKRLKEFKDEKRNMLYMLRVTFMPSKWWLGVYYGANTFIGGIWCMLSKHSFHVLWWAKLYYSLSKMRES